MIISAILDLLKTLITTIFGVLPNIPDIPEQLLNGINSFLDIIFDNAGLFGVFIPLDLVKIAIPLAILISNFDKVYSITMWVLKKIPMLGVND